MENKTSPVTKVFFVYVNGMFERECRTLGGARRSAAALERKGFSAQVACSYRQADRGWMEYL